MPHSRLLRSRLTQRYENFFHAATEAVLLCPLCIWPSSLSERKEFSSFKLLVKHLHQSHGSFVNLFACGGCCTAFYDITQLKKHDCSAAYNASQELNEAVTGLLCEDCGLWLPIPAVEEEETERRRHVYDKIMSTHNAMRMRIVTIYSHQQGDSTPSERKYFEVQDVPLTKTRSLCSTKEEWNCSECSEGFRDFAKYISHLYSEEASTLQRTSPAEVLNMAFAQHAASRRLSATSTHAKERNFRKYFNKIVKFAKGSEVEEIEEAVSKLGFKLEMKVFHSTKDSQSELQELKFTDLSLFKSLNLDESVVMNSDSEYASLRQELRIPTIKLAKSLENTILPENDGFKTNVFLCNKCQRILLVDDRHKYHICDEEEVIADGDLDSCLYSAMPISPLTRANCPRCGDSVCSLDGLKRHLILYHGVHFEEVVEADQEGGVLVQLLPTTKKEKEKTRSEENAYANILKVYAGIFDEKSRSQSEEVPSRQSSAKRKVKDEDVVSKRIKKSNEDTNAESREEADGSRCSSVATINTVTSVRSDCRGVSALPENTDAASIATEEGEKDIEVLATVPSTSFAQENDSYWPISTNTCDYLPQQKTEFFLCRICCSLFDGKEAYRDHLEETHSTDQYISCPYCSLVIYIPLLASHIQDHQTRIEYVCGAHPEETFVDDSHYYLHIQNVHGRDLYIFCKMCHRFSKDYAAMSKHLMEDNCRDAAFKGDQELEKIYQYCVMAEMQWNLSDEVKKRKSEVSEDWAIETCEREPCSSGRSMVLKEKLWVERDERGPPNRVFFFGCPKDAFLIPERAYHAHEKITPAELRKELSSFHKHYRSGRINRRVEMFSQRVLRFMRNKHCEVSGLPFPKEIHHYRASGKRKSDADSTEETENKKPWLQESCFFCDVPFTTRTPVVFAACDIERWTRAYVRNINDVEGSLNEETRKEYERFLAKAAAQPNDKQRYICARHFLRGTVDSQGKLIVEKVVPRKYLNTTTPKASPEKPAHKQQACILCLSHVAQNFVKVKWEDALSLLKAHNATETDLNDRQAYFGCGVQYLCRQHLPQCPPKSLAPPISVSTVSSSTDENQKRQQQQLQCQSQQPDPVGLSGLATQQLQPKTQQVQQQYLQPNLVPYPPPQSVAGLPQQPAVAYPAMSTAQQPLHHLHQMVDGPGNAPQLSLHQQQQIELQRHYAHQRNLQLHHQQMQQSQMAREQQPKQLQPVSMQTKQRLMQQHQQHLQKQLQLQQQQRLLQHNLQQQSLHQNNLQQQSLHQNNLQQQPQPLNQPQSQQQQMVKQYHQRLHHHHQLQQQQLQQQQQMQLAAQPQGQQQQPAQQQKSLKRRIQPSHLEQVQRPGQPQPPKRPGLSQQPQSPHLQPPGQLSAQLQQPMQQQPVQQQGQRQEQQQPVQRTYTIPPQKAIQRTMQQQLVPQQAQRPVQHQPAQPIQRPAQQVSQQPVERPVPQQVVQQPGQRQVQQQQTQQKAPQQVPRPAMPLKLEPSPQSQHEQEQEAQPQSPLHPLMAQQLHFQQLQQQQRFQQQQLEQQQHYHQQFQRQQLQMQQQHNWQQHQQRLQQMQPPCSTANQPLAHPMLPRAIAAPPTSVAYPAGVPAGVRPMYPVPPMQLPPSQPGFIPASAHLNYPPYPPVMTSQAGAVTPYAVGSAPLPAPQLRRPALEAALAPRHPPLPEWGPPASMQQPAPQMQQPAPQMQQPAPQMPQQRTVSQDNATIRLQHPRLVAQLEDGSGQAASSSSQSSPRSVQQSGGSTDSGQTSQQTVSRCVICAIQRTGHFHEIPPHERRDVLGRILGNDIRVSCALFAAMKYNKGAVKVCSEHVNPVVRYTPKTSTPVCVAPSCWQPLLPGSTQLHNLHTKFTGEMKEKLFFCLICFTPCKTEISAVEHYYSKHFKPPSGGESGPLVPPLTYRIQCPFVGCDVNLKSMNEYREHLISGVAPHKEFSYMKASVCRLGFARDHQFEEHIQEHESHPESSSCCYVCGLVDQPKGSIGEGDKKVDYDHMMLHTLKLVYFCRECLQPLNNGNKPRYHLEDCHTINEEGCFKCNVCSHQPNLATSLDRKQHAVSHHLVIGFVGNRPNEAVVEISPDCTLAFLGMLDNEEEE